MNFIETVLATVLGTSISALVAWGAVRTYRWWRLRRAVWRVRYLGDGRYGLKFLRRRRVWTVQILPQGPNVALRTPQPALFQNGGGSPEEVLPDVGEGGHWQLSWQDSRGYWVARILPRDGLDPWTVAPEAFQRHGSDVARELP